MDLSASRLQRAYHALLKAVSDVLEAKESADSHRTARTDAALEHFYSTFQLFQATCDQAQEFVDSVRQRIGSECIVDEATGPISQKLIKLSEEGANRSAIPPLSATRLEQMSKAVRLLVLELQPGSSTAIPQPSIDSRPADDMSH
ncbi:hypothetical protein MPTK1_7g09990 [Marchantia polymorpha subsp. ruderalis]|uniref:Uncharacterized protein n=2 Tax=Marchantia polymorpha TaxID=3197 RepID=A0AAF6BXY6_MARPO|nr:hypothetical protein MARPO_0003s0019 [Marchantia polymorpha]BBN16870.1 hypothetical protein Mp_7g10000 [Marchantia polymorpha subsp. ruderalis]|eukprot:PTQ49110.1 hypothetical protein MARPO_0003s0019 [Marchantia polymorpha]